MSMFSQQKNLPSETLNKSKLEAKIAQIQALEEFYPPKPIVKKPLKEFLLKNGFILICIFFIVFNWFSNMRRVEQFQFITGFFIIWLGVKVQVLLHELGHSLMGLLTGRKLLILCLGSWRYEHTLAGWRWRKARQPKGSSGFALMLPKHLNSQSDSIKGKVLFLLGGVLANLLCAAFLYWIAKLGMLSKWLEIFVYVFATSALIIGLLNLLPITVAGWCTDGKQILQLLTKQKETLADTIYRLGVMSITEIRPCDWPVDEFFPTVDEEIFKKQSFQVKFGYRSLQMAYALDVDDKALVDQCAQWLASNFAAIPDGQKQSIAYQMAYYALKRWQSVDLFAAWRCWCDNGSVLNLQAYYCMLDAFHAWLLKDEYQAKYYIQKTRAAFSTLLFEKSEVFLEKNLEKFESSINSKKEVIIQKNLR